jgi:PKD repeat protein
MGYLSSDKQKLMKKLILSALFGFAASLVFAQTMIQAPLPPAGSTFTGNVRGYWFAAPDCFTITGLQVATEAGAGTQNIAVLRLDTLPNVYPTVTNAFTVLFLTQNDPTAGIIPCNIQVQAGDSIMIIGQRGNVNSYSASGSWTTTINGITTNIYRSGMQFQLNTTAPQDLWVQASGSVSRVHMYYDSVITFTATHTVLNQSDVQFNSNADPNITSVWDYGDGSPLDTVNDPMHTYATGGTYTVYNYVTTTCGIDTMSMTVTVCGSAVTTANYSASTAGAMAMFTNSSTNAQTYFWDFGDSNTSTAQNPTHTYASSGTYNVCLIATNGVCGADTICTSVTVCIPTTAAFTASEDSLHNWTFTDGSTNATMWMWDFGDATTSTAQNPTHTYAMNGTYIVCLVSGDCATDTVCSTITTCPEVLSGGFTSTDTLMDATFMSTDPSALSYWWDFGDGNFDSIANPTHTYANTGLYTVCLTVWNLCGDSITTCDTVLLVITDIAVNGNAKIGVYPNPASSSATVMVTSVEYSGNYVFEVTDAAGKLVRTENGVFGQQLNINRDNIAAGTYIYKVRVNEVVIGNGKLMFTE